METESKFPRSKKWQKSLDRISQETQGNSKYWEERAFGENIKVKNYLEKLFRNCSQPKILNVGAGIFWRSYIPKKYHNGVTIVDWVENENEKNLVVADIEEGLPFESGTFDVVLSKQLFGHLEEWGKSLLEMNRVLKKDGLLIVMEFEGYQIDGKTRFSVFDPAKVKTQFEEFGFKPIKKQILLEKPALDIPYNVLLTAVTGRKI